MSRQSVASGSPYEAEFGFRRAVRIGQHIMVSGTAPIAEDGSTAAPGDAYGQAMRCIDIIAAALETLGGSLADVARTRMFIAAPEVWPEVARAHGARFGGVMPAATAVICALLRSDWLVEIEADAILADAPESLLE